jgi:quinol monooxygenase YgiN
MAETHLTILAEMYAKPGLENTLSEVLSGLVEPTRKEQGCIGYSLHTDNNDPAHFFFYETWKSRADLDRHLATPHLCAFLSRESELLREPSRLVFATRLH